MEHLYQLGYQRIAFIGGNPNSSASQERMEGYQRALTRSGLQFDPLLVIPSAPTRRGGYDSVQRLLQIEDRPTAALCFNDVVALGVIEAIQLAGLKVGAGFGLIGSNDVSADTEPALTTIDTAPRQLGETAAELFWLHLPQSRGLRNSRFFAGSLRALRGRAITVCFGRGFGTREDVKPLERFSIFNPESDFNRSIPTI